MIKKLFLLLFSVYAINLISAQSICKVKLEAINISYKGECEKGYANGQGEAKGEKDFYKGSFKKGLPHGLGIYTWGNGSIYNGDFSKGKMDGKGKLVIKEGSNVLKIEEGYFEDNEYIGMYNTPYKVLTKREVQKISFQENNLNLGNFNQVIIKVKHAGRFIYPSITVSDENYSPAETVNDGIKLMNVNFPLKKITVSFIYEGFSCYSVFEIYKKSDWEVVVHI